MITRVEIAEPRTHRCLSYIGAVSRQGYKLKVSEFRTFARRPQRRTTQSSPASVASSLAKMLEGRTTEPMLDYLYRLGWVDIVGPSTEIEDDDVVALTDLGRAVLSALDEGSLEDEVPAVILLDQDDPIAKARVIGEIAGLGECALVDRYFSADDFLAILQRTQVTRILTGPDPQKRLAGLGQALADVRRERQFEIRVTDVFHDRFAISPTEVRQIGTSLNGLSKRLSIMVTMSDDAAATAIRAAFETAWSDGQPLGAPVQWEADDAPTKEAARDVPETEPESSSA